VEALSAVALLAWHWQLIGPEHIPQMVKQSTKSNLWQRSRCGAMLWERKRDGVAPRRHNGTAVDLLALHLVFENVGDNLARDCSVPQIAEVVKEETVRERQAVDPKPYPFRLLVEVI
jgi:hypothetical protein